MNFFKKKYRIRRYTAPKIIRGYSSIPYTDTTLLMDVQTLENVTVTTSDGTRSIQKLKTFCDEIIYVENQQNQQKADRLWFQDKWFECTSCRLSENTPLKHYTATFTECLDNEKPPGETEVKDESDGS